MTQEGIGILIVVGIFCGTLILAAFNGGFTNEDFFPERTTKEKK